MNYAITEKSLEQINENEFIWEEVKIENCGKEERVIINAVGDGYLKAYSQMEFAYDELVRKMGVLKNEARLIICELESKLLKNNKVKLQGRLIANGKLVLSN